MPSRWPYARSRPDQRSAPNSRISSHAMPGQDSKAKPPGLGTNLRGLPRSARTLRSAIAPRGGLGSKPAPRRPKKGNLSYQNFHQGFFFGWGASVLGASAFASSLGFSSGFGGCSGCLASDDTASHRSQSIKPLLLAFRCSRRRCCYLPDLTPHLPMHRLANCAYPIPEGRIAHEVRRHTLNLPWRERATWA